MPAPICRESLFQSLLGAFEYSEHLLLVSGPISSGKTITIQAVCSELRSSHDFRTAHAFCETGSTISEVFSDVYRQLTDSDQRYRTLTSLAKFLDRCPIEVPTLIVLDSFDHLDTHIGLTVFRQIEAAVDQQLNPFLSFVIVAHSSPGFFMGNVFSHLHVQFPAYSRTDLIQIVAGTFGTAENHLARVIDICAPLTRDIRDVIFVVHTLGDDIDGPEVGPHVMEILDTMRGQQISRINDLARSAAALLLGAYIASKTSVLSDLLRFARTMQKRSKKPRLLENHDWVSSERVFALAKAIIHAHLGTFETDFSLRLQLNKLKELGLIDLRGDPYLEPKVVCLATDREVNALADAYKIRLHEYLTE
jgi:origin recognition complex subunit 5